MYDVVVIGQGLTGMLSAIWAKEQGESVALVHQGAGRILQSTGVMDILPASDGDINDLINEYKLDDSNNAFIDEGISKYKELMKKIGYPYMGDINSKAEIVTGSGHCKYTAMYPETIKPIPEKGHIVIISIQEIADFQATFAKENLKKCKPDLEIDTVNVDIGTRSFRTMTQLDVARLLEKDDIRASFIAQINEKINDKNLENVDLFVIPAVLGVNDWRKVKEDFETKLGAPITEAVGMPPNATSIRLYERLRKELIRSGVRLYSESNVIASEIVDNNIKSIKVENINRVIDLKADKYILATGGVIGGGLNLTADGLKETALGIEIDETGKPLQKLENLYMVGASNGLEVVRSGITGGIYSILSSYKAVSSNNFKDEGGDR